MLTELQVNLAVANVTTGAGRACKGALGEKEQGEINQFLKTWSRQRNPTLIP